MAQQIKTKFIEDLAITTAKLAAASVTGAKIESSVALAGAPTAATASIGTNTTQIATTAFVQAAVNAASAGLKPKEAVRAASSVNVDLSSALVNSAVIGGVTLATGDRVLLYGQTDASENGIYVTVASGAASRATDFDSLTPIDEINRAWVAVQEGAQAGKIFVQYGLVETLGTDDINFSYYDPIAATSLNTAYTVGNVITTSSSDGNVEIGGTEKLLVSADGGLEVSETISASGWAANLDNWIAAGSGAIGTNGKLEVRGTEAYFHSESDDSGYYELFLQNVANTVSSDFVIYRGGADQAESYWTVKNTAGQASIRLERTVDFKTDLNFYNDNGATRFSGGQNVEFSNNGGVKIEPATPSGQALIINQSHSGQAAIGVTASVSGHVLSLKGDSTGSISIYVPSGLTSDYLLTLPSNDGDTGQFLQTDGNGLLSWASVVEKTWAKEKITLTGTDITNGYVDLANEIIDDSLIAIVGRLAMHKTEDYTLSVVGGVTRLTFAGSLAVGQPEALASGDALFFTYQYA